MLLNPMVLTVCCMQTIQSFMLLLTLVADNPPLQTLKSASLTFRHFSQKTNLAATPLLYPRFLNFSSMPGIKISDLSVPNSKEVSNVGAMFGETFAEWENTLISRAQSGWSMRSSLQG